MTAGLIAAALIWGTFGTISIRLLKRDVFDRSRRRRWLSE